MDKVLAILKTESGFFGGWLKSKTLGIVLVYSLACSVMAQELSTFQPWPAVGALAVGGLVVSVYLLAEALKSRAGLQAIAAHAAALPDPGPTPPPVK